MFKYLYLLGVVFSFLTFSAGWNHFAEYEIFTIFNFGLMALTPITSFLLTLIWLMDQNKKIKIIKKNT